MSKVARTLLLTSDDGLLTHWLSVFGKSQSKVVSSFAELAATALATPTQVWVDTSVAGLPDWRHADWRKLLQSPWGKIVATSSNPKDALAIQALDAGCAGYCHAFADRGTLLQVQQVVDAGHVWIGPSLMQQLIQTARKVPAPAVTAADDWDETLTPREREVAVLAANGASNQAISAQCGISERTVKAHLSAIFVKLNITDRLQLALRVHGIH
jgi:DNA-binding NarL/FixJ family response regulator